MKTALITGGSGGIGSAIVKRFAEAGYAVAFTYHTAKDAAESLARSIDNVPVLLLQANLTREEEVLSLAERFYANFSHIDVLVNCAGVASEGLFQDVTDAEYARVTDANLKSTFLVTRAFLPGMIAEQKGAIVNVSSMWGVTGASMEVLYSATKAGVIGMTKALAKEVGASNVRVNAVAPGMIDTKMNDGYTAEEKSAFLEGVALGRMGKAEEVASAVLFLAEAEYVTGQTLAVDGGVCI